jgi:hypothetical protein
MAQKPKRKARKSTKPGKHPGGRPTKYKPGYCKAIIEFFSRAPNHKELMEVSTSEGRNSRGGTNDFRKEKFQLVPNEPPFFEDFATSIGVSDDTIVNWAKQHKEFLAAYNRAKFLQKRFLIVNGLAGCYPPASYIFTAKNITDMRDSHEVEDKKTFEITGLEQLDDAQLDNLIKALQGRVGKGVE